MYTNFPAPEAPVFVYITPSRSMLDAADPVCISARIAAPMPPHLCEMYFARRRGYILPLTLICTYREGESPCGGNRTEAHGAGKKRRKGAGMKTRFYLDGKKTTRKTVKELVGEDRLRRMTEEAKETFFEDPLVQNDFFLGRDGMLTIEFC